VGIQLIAQSNTLLPELIKVAKEFESYLKTIKGTENVANSSTDTPGQFVFRFDLAQLKRLGLTPGSLLPELYSNLNGIKASSIKGLYQEHDIVVKYDTFEKGVNPEDIQNTILSSPS
jgi:multidrug efflux pump subunit AcrB